MTWNDSGTVSKASGAAKVVKFEFFQRVWEGLRVLLRFTREGAENSCLVGMEDALLRVRGDNNAADNEQVAIVFGSSSHSPSIYLFPGSFYRVMLSKCYFLFL